MADDSSTIKDIVQPFIDDMGRHWTTKMVNYFYKNDSDRDWLLTESQFKNPPTDHLPDDKKAAFSEITGYIWDHYLRPFCKSSTDQTTSDLQLYLEGMTQELKNNKKELTETVRTIAGLLFRALDSDGNGALDKDDVVDWLKTHNFPDDVMAECYAAMDKNKDGIVESYEFQEDALLYFTCLKPSSGDLHFGQLFSLEHMLKDS